MSGLDDDLREELGRRVRRLRTERGLTLAVLADQVGITPSALSQIERGKSEPSLGTLWRLGGALKASLLDFFAHDRPAPVDVTRAAERTLVEFERFRYEAVARSSRRTIDFFVLRLEPGDGPVRALVSHPGEEAGLVLAGSMDVTVGGETHRLGPGDGIWFLSSEPHTFATAGAEPCVSVWADTIPEAEGEGDVWSRSLFGMTAAESRDGVPAGPRAGAGAGGVLAVARALPVDPAALRSDIDELAAIGSRPDGFRVTGTPEDRRTARAIAERMRAAGLRDVALEPVNVDGWRPGACHLKLAGRIFHGASLGGTPGTPAGGIRGMLVDAARADRHRLDRLDVAGRIALVDWYSLSVAPADMALELAGRGAVGMVIAPPAGGPLYQADNALGSFDSHWHAGGPPVLTLSKEDAAELRRSLEARPQAPEVTLTVKAKLTPDTNGWNVVGWLPGSEPGPPIVIGAHHDAWFSGAFDNASGVAVLLALAEGLTSLGHRPRHTVCFTSRTAEEYGRAHSPFDWCTGAWGQIHDQHPDWADAPFHLCLEASGHPELRHIVEAPVELTKWARRICRAADREGWMKSGWRVAPPVSGTEQWPYLLAGVPGVASYFWETSFRRTSYHTPLDTSELIDFDQLAATVRLDALLLLDADANPDAIHDHGARARHLKKAAEALGPAGRHLAAAADRHAGRRGRQSFGAIGRNLHALDAHGALAYPHVQAAADVRHLDAALVALEQDDTKAAIKALEAVGSNRLTRVLSAAAFGTQQERTHPEAPNLSWGAASHLTRSPNLWDELASLRGEPGSRRPGRWLPASLRAHRRRSAREVQRRLDAMTAALQPHATEAI